MDPEDLPNFIEGLNTTKESRVDVLRLVSSQGIVTEATLDDDGVESELAKVKESAIKPLIGAPAPLSTWGPFVLFSAAGDPAYKSKPMSISKSSLTNLLVTCELPPFTLISCGVKRFHLSHHIQYDQDGNDEPVALLLLLRIARNSQSISIAMRIRLADLATVVFMTSMTEATGQMIRRKCIERRHLLAKHPLYLLVLIYEDRCFEYKRWFDDILEEINVVESATGMTRNTWKMQLSPRLREWFSDYDNLLRMLYASNTELSHFDTVTTFSIKFGDLLLMALKVLEELRVEVGLAPLQKREFRCLQERIAFTRSRCDLTADKTREMLERVKGQINVAFNLVAQRDSKINLAVAEESKHVATLAARDSETMKTITVLTLLFLPSTLVTVNTFHDVFFFCAGIIFVEQRWTCLLTWNSLYGLQTYSRAVVFTAWFLYLRLSSLKRKERPLHIAGVGYIREGKVVGMGTTDRDGLSFDIRKETNWHEK